MFITTTIRESLSTTKSGYFESQENILRNFQTIEIIGS